ncbi:hypothetical protein BJX76DRAFT_366156 [Aspergillus varians]
MPPPPLSLALTTTTTTTTTTTIPILPTIIPRADSDSNTPTHITSDSISIPSTYGRTTNPPSPGVVVGATLGSVAGFLLILYLIYLALTSGRRFSASTIAPTSTTPSEIIDVGFRNRPPRSRRARNDEVIVEEDVTLTDRSRSDRGGRGGVVEVIEEESVVDPPPSGSWRVRSRSRSRSRSLSSVSSRSRSDRYRRGGRGAYGGESEFSGRT